MAARSVRFIMEHVTSPRKPSLMTRLPAENIGVCPPDVTASPREYNNPHIHYPTHSQASKCPLNCSVHNCAAIQRFSLESVIKQTGNLTTG